MFYSLKLNIETASENLHPEKGGMPAGIHVPRGWCSKIKIQINTSADGPDASDLGLKVAPVSSSSENLK